MSFLLSLYGMFDLDVPILISWVDIGNYVQTELSGVKIP